MSKVGPEGGAASFADASVALPRHMSERLPALDGVRGIAIILILLLHFADVSLPHTTSRLIGIYKSWGWAGVDLFFALSGFLITTILLDAKGSPHYFRTFYARRALRIFPAYYLLLALCFWVLPQVEALADALRPPVYGPSWTYWTHTSNFYFAYRGFAEGPLGHSWSLSVEEQFYLVWPAVVLACSRASLRTLIGAMIVLVPLLRGLLLLGGTAPLAIYFNTLTRLDGLAVGALLAVLISGGMARADLLRFARLLLPVAGLGLAASVVSKRWGVGFELWLEASKYSFVALGSAALVAIAIALPREHALSRALRARPLTFLGRYSYGLYLFHLPVVHLVGVKFQASQPVLGAWLGLLIYLSVTIALAQLSWVLVERPFIRLKRFFPATATEPIRAVAPAT